MATPREMQGLLRPIGRIKPFYPVGLYNKYIGNSPLADTLVMAGALAVAGKFGGEHAAKKITESLLTRLPEDQRESAARQMYEEGGIKDIGTIGAVLGAGAGGLYGWKKHSKTPEDYMRWRLWQSSLGPRYPYGSRGYMYKARTKLPAGYMEKQQSWYPTEQFERDTIPIGASISLIGSDPFLTWDQKEVTRRLIEQAEKENRGLISGKDLMQSAVQAGIGFSTAYLFGRGLGAVLSLPAPLAKKMSFSGGVAGAILNTGILEKLL